MTNAKKKFYVTTPIYYPNDIPHLGHAYTTIAADVLARFHRSLGDEVLFTTGTDEHGQKIEEAAKKAGKGTQEFLDELTPRFKDAWKTLNISHDEFIRTTDSKHKIAVTELIKRCHENGDIYKGEYEGMYCVACEAFYLEKDLNDGNCKIHKTKTVKVKEESYFFRLSKYQEKLLEFYKTNPEFLSPKHKKDEITNRVKEGLNDLSITRTSFKWGIPFPLDSRHVTYVWFDALTNYLTCAGFPSDNKKFEEFWPANVHLVGKDIMWFHQVIWPAMLMSAKLETPKKVFAHGWWTVNGEKMSKSLGNVIEPITIAEKFGTDELRYFVLKEAPFGEDGDFSEKSLMQRINSELSNDLGNLLSRAITLIEKNFESIIPEKGVSKAIDEHLVKESEIFDEFNAQLESLEFNNALSTIWKLIQETNKYVNATEPWKIQDKERLGTVLYHVCEVLRIISIYINPFMPSKAAEIRKQIGITSDECFKTLKQNIKPGTKVCKGTNLFKKHDLLAIEKKEAEDKKKLELEKKKNHETRKIEEASSSGANSSLEGFALLNLKVGEIVEIRKHPNADKLFVEKIDFGNEVRQVVSGIADYYTAEQLLGRKVVVVTNLKAAKIRGEESQGMLLAAEEKDDVGVLFVEKTNKGEQVIVDTIKPNLNEITFNDFLKVKMEVKSGLALFENKNLISDKTGEKVMADKITNGSIR